MLRTLCAIAIATTVWFVQPGNASDRLNKGVTPQATTDPLRLIYRVVGVRGGGPGDRTGTSTSFHCFNGSNDVENLRIRIFTFDGRAVSDDTFGLVPKQTFTGSTHATAVFSEDAFLAPNVSIDQGTAFIWATSDKVLCSAMIVSSTATEPVGIALHLVRYRAAKGSQE